MIRIAICQQRLRHYRVPVFDLLGEQEDIELTVFADPDSSVGVTADDGRSFRLVRSVTSPVRWLPGGFVRQHDQLAAIDPRRFDLVVLPWDIHYLPTLWPAMGRGRRRGVKVALWGHGYSKRSGGTRRALRNLLGRRADAVLLYSRRVAEEMVGAGFDPRRVFVAPNALDQRPIQAARRHWLERPDDLRAFQERHGVDPRRSAVFLSRLLPDNRAGMLIEALAGVRLDCPDARLVVIGDGPARGDLEGLAARLGQAEHVTFTGAIFDDLELAPWMLSCAFLAYPINIGLTLLHAFGFGLPVVTSDRPFGHGPEFEALEDGRNGLLYRDGSLDDLTAIWKRLLNDRDLRETLSRNALDEVGNRFTLPHMIEGFLDLCSIVDGRPRVAGGGKGA